MFGKEQVDVPRVAKMAIMTIFSLLYFLSPLLKGPLLDKFKSVLSENGISGSQEVWLWSNTSQELVTWGYIASKLNVILREIKKYIFSTILDVVSIKKNMVHLESRRTIGAFVLIKAKNGFGNLKNHAFPKTISRSRCFDGSSFSLSFSLNHIVWQRRVIVLCFTTFHYMWVVWALTCSVVICFNVDLLPAVFWPQIPQEKWA